MFVVHRPSALVFVNEMGVLNHAELKLQPFPCERKRQCQFARLNLSSTELREVPTAVVKLDATCRLESVTGNYNSACCRY